MTPRRARVVATPIGPLALVVEGAALAQVRFDGRIEPDEVEDPAAASDVVAWLASYFAGHPGAFEGALADRGTPFQRAVWDAVRGVPFGASASYADIAERVGDPAAVRAVGAANGANPWPLVVPCHRVVGASGSLTGYSGGIDRKAWLLRHEGALLL